MAMIGHCLFSAKAYRKASGSQAQNQHEGKQIYRHRPQIALQEKLDTMARAATQSREKDGKGKQDLLNHHITASTSKPGKKMTRRQQQPRAKSGTETSLGNTAAAAAKSEILKGETNLGDKPAAAAKSEVMKGDKLEKQDGSGSQERNHEGRQAWGDKAAAAAKSEIMRNHEGRQAWRQGDSGSQKRNHEGRQAWETSRQRQPRAKS